MKRSIDHDIGAPERRKLRFREHHEALRTAYFRMEELVANLPPDEAEDAVDTWIDGFRHATGPLVRSSVRKIVADEPRLAERVNVDILLDATASQDRMKLDVSERGGEDKGAVG